MNEERTCPHAFDCWYRVGGQCCHGLVDNVGACTGMTPTLLHQALNIRRVDAPNFPAEPIEVDQTEPLIILRLAAR